MMLAATQTREDLQCAACLERGNPGMLDHDGRYICHECTLVEALVRKFETTARPDRPRFHTAKGKR